MEFDPLGGDIHQQIVLGQLVADPTHPFQIDPNLGHPLLGGDVHGGEGGLANATINLEAVARLEVPDRLLQLGPVKITTGGHRTLIVAGDPQPLADDGDARIMHAGLQLGTRGDGRPATRGGVGAIAHQALLELGIKSGLLTQGGNGGLEIGRRQGASEIGGQGLALGSVVVVPVLVDGAGIDLAITGMVEQAQQAIAQQDLGIDALLALEGRGIATREQLVQFGDVEIRRAKAEVAAVLGEGLKVGDLTRIDPGKGITASGVGLIEQLGRGQTNICQDRLGLLLEFGEPLLQQVTPQGQGGQQQEHQGQDQPPPCLTQTCYRRRFTRIQVPHLLSSPASQAAMGPRILV